MSKLKVNITGTDADAICAIVNALNAAGEFTVSIKSDPAAFTYHVHTLPMALNDRLGGINRVVHCIACSGSLCAWSVRSGPSLAAPF